MVLPTKLMSVKFHDFAELLLIFISFQQITCKLGNFTDLKCSFYSHFDGFHFTI